jgi:hypothetical protein
VRAHTRRYQPGLQLPQHTRILHLRQPARSRVWRMVELAYHTGYAQRMPDRRTMPIMPRRFDDSVLARQTNIRPTILAERGLGVASVASSLALAPPADFRSTDSSRSFSSASIFMVLGLLTKVLLRGLPARNDRLQEDRALVRDVRLRTKRYGQTSPKAQPRKWRAKAGTAPGTHVVLASDDDTLAGVKVGVRVLEDVEQVATSASPRRAGEVPR